MSDFAPRALHAIRPPQRAVASELQAIEVDTLIGEYSPGRKRINRITKKNEVAICPELAAMLASEIASGNRLKNGSNRTDCPEADSIFAALELDLRADASSFQNPCGIRSAGIRTAAGTTSVIARSIGMCWWRALRVILDATGIARRGNARS